MVAAAGRLARRTNVHPRYPYWHRRQFLSAVVPVVQSKEAGQPLQRRRLHAETDQEPQYPPRTFHELMAWSRCVLRQGPRIFTPILPAPVTLLANNYPIMVDARPNIKTLTWPADPFDLAHFDSNTTAYFNYVPISTSAKAITCRLYTPAFKQYASSKIQRYILAVVEQGIGSYVVRFVNEAYPINAGIYTDIILEGDLSENIQVSMHIVDKDKTNVYLRASTSGTRVVTTSTVPAVFVLTFYNL
eukprot:Em0014g448a